MKMNISIFLDIGLVEVTVCEFNENLMIKMYVEDILVASWWINALKNFQTWFFQYLVAPTIVDGISSGIHNIILGSARIILVLISNRGLARVLWLQTQWKNDQKQYIRLDGS